jgi:hypothetical protein
MPHGTHAGTPQEMTLPVVPRPSYSGPVPLTGRRLALITITPEITRNHDGSCCAGLGGARSLLG